MSTAALTVVQPTETSMGLFADNPAERRRMFLNLFQKNISEDQLALLFGICDRYGFDPMLKHVVLISQAMYVTRDGMRQYAHRTGLWDGIEELDKGQDERGKWRVTVAVYRKGCARPFVTTAYQVEHENANSKPWQSSPYRMTFKCAELAALRMAFPVELGGAEEVGFDGSARTNIGTATIIDAEATPSVAAEVTTLEALPDEDLLAELGYELPEAQERNVVEIYIGRGTDKASTLARLDAVKAKGVPKKVANEIAIAHATALGIPVTPKQPQPAEPPLTEVVGEPEHPQARRIANIRALAQRAGWDEARLATFAKQMYLNDDLTRLSGDQLVSIENFIRAGNHDAAAG